MPRGRLIFPFRVTLGLLDTAATAADPDAAGPLSAGYDDEFREPVMVPPASGSARGQLRRVETTVELFAQVEDDRQGQLNMAASGNAPTNAMGLVFHYRDLELAGAVQLAAGKPIIKAPGARLISIANPRTGELIERFDDVPGFWATEARSMGFGLGPYRNLLLVIFQERDQSVSGSGG
jgi:hypothetical protein